MNRSSVIITVVSGGSFDAYLQWNLINHNAFGLQSHYAAIGSSEYWQKCFMLNMNIVQSVYGKSHLSASERASEWARERRKIKWFAFIVAVLKIEKCRHAKAVAATMKLKWIEYMHKMTHNCKAQEHRTDLMVKTAKHHELLFAEFAVDLNF